MWGVLGGEVTITVTDPALKLKYENNKQVIVMVSYVEAISKILERKFVFTEDMARILALAFAGKKNVIVFGPGGHAKSAMVKEVIDQLAMDEEAFYQFFGEGMDESRLFGGLNFKKLEEEKILEYFPENSFLNSKIAVFEELFDAPASVLLALKDVLTAKELRNGSQRFKMKTELIICLTNKEPSEISELGPAAHALVERFPLQHNLKWKDYTAKSYLHMFEKIASSMEGPILNGFKNILAEILAKATSEGNFVSPRTAVHAFQICQTSALLRRADHVEKQDLIDLRFLPGLEGLAETIQKDMEDAMARAAAEKAVAAAEEKMKLLKKEFEGISTPIKFLQAAKKFESFQDELSVMKVTDNLSDKRKVLRESAAQMMREAQENALRATHL